MKKKEKKRQDKIVLLSNTNLNTMKVLLSKALIDSDISNDEFVSVNKFVCISKKQFDRF